MDAVARGHVQFRRPGRELRGACGTTSRRSTRHRSTSDLWQVQATLAQGPVRASGRSAAGRGRRPVSRGVDQRAERKPANDAGNQYDRYYSINSVGTAGSRNVKSAFFEIGRSDSSISSRSTCRAVTTTTRRVRANFSPKIGAKFTPIRKLAIRGTWSKGFRIPSFNEAFGLPTTGYVERTCYRVNCARLRGVLRAHGNNAYATAHYPLGLTQVGNPALDPEKSTAFTAGVIFEPIRNISFTVDFWQHQDQGPDHRRRPTRPDAATPYYANNGVVNIPGITVLPGAARSGVPERAAADRLHPVARSQNQDSQIVSGIDFGVNVRTADHRRHPLRSARSRLRT